MKKHSENKQDSIKEVLQNILRTERAYQTYLLIIKSIRVFLIILFIYFVVELSFYTNVSTKLFFVFTALFAALVFYFEKWFRSDKKDFKTSYRRIAIDLAIPEISYLMDLKLDNRETTAFSEIALEQLEEELNAKKWIQKSELFLKNHPLRIQIRQQLKILLGIALILTLLPFLAERGWQRTLTFWQEFERPNPFQFLVSPGSVTLEQGAEFIGRIQFRGITPKHVYLEFKTDIESEYRNYKLEMSDSVYYSDAIRMNSKSEYRFRMDQFQSPLYHIKIKTLPRFDTLMIAVTPPKYTKLTPSLSIYPFSNLAFPEGSNLSFSGKLNKPLSSLSLNFSNHAEAHFNQLSDRFQYSFTLKQTDTLLFSMKDTDLLINENPYRTLITAIIDEYPTVKIVQPISILKIIEPDKLNLLIEAGDDYGLSRAQLKWEIKNPFSKNVRKANTGVPLTKRESGLISFDWNLAALHLQPQEELSYWVEVWDNDAINQPKKSQSAVQFISIPSLTEQFLGEQEAEDQISETYSDIDERMDQMQKSYQEFLEKLADDPNKLTENQRKLDEVQDQKRKIDEKVSELNKQFDALKDQLQESMQLSDETQKAYDDLQKLVKEIQNEDFMKALEELERSMNRFDQRSIQEALQQVKFDEQKYQERINRTIELFKKVKLNADLDRVSKALEELAQKQDDLASDSTLSNESAQNVQEQLNKELQSIQKIAEQLDKNPPERLKDEIEALKSELEQGLNEAQSDMEQSADDLSENKQGEAQQKQQKAAKKMQELKQMLQDFKSKMNQEQQMVDRNALEAILAQMILMSDSQEKIGLKANELNPKSNGFIQLARNQQVINRVFQIAGDSLFRIASVNPALSNKVLEKKTEVLAQLNKGMSFLTDRDSRAASFQSRTAMAGMNELASMLVSILEQPQDPSDGEGGGGGGTPEQMLEQLRNSKQQQQQLNQQLEDLINDMQGNRLNQSQMERMEQISKMQQQIRKQIQDIQKQGHFEQGDRILSDLQRMVEEMEDAINDMRGGKTDPITVKRQQNILSRMLQAEKSLDERDEDEKRKATQPKEVKEATPPEMTLEELKKKILNQLQNGELTPYSPEYQNLIDLYFKELEKKIN